MRALGFLALVELAACGKQLNPEFCAAHPDDSRCLTAGDANKPDALGRFDVAHLGADVEGMLTSNASVVIAEATTINTTTGMIAAPLPSGAVVLPSVAQDNGPDVMVIQAVTFRIEQPLTVIGDKPLIIVALGEITLANHILASADMDIPGAGGALPTMGMGAGNAGSTGNNISDSGGGGGGFGTQGGDGGDVDGRAGGNGGNTYGAAGALQGGSGGGRGTGPNACSSPPGAGGGAIQLSAGVAITIDSGAGIAAGGGGGRGGGTCFNTNGGSGSAGGSGGMIYLQAPSLRGNGQLGANGGGGGGAASYGGLTVGQPGQNAQYMTGGSGGSGGGNGGPGGDGGDGNNPGLNGGNNTNMNENGGGGGGGVGRIYYQTTGTQPSYMTSPPHDKV